MFSMGTAIVWSVEFESGEVVAKVAVDMVAAGLAAMIAMAEIDGC